VKSAKQHTVKINQIGEIRQLCIKKEIEVNSTSDLYKKNKAQKELIALRQKLEAVESPRTKYTPDPVLLYEIETLKGNLSKDRQILFSGIINYPEISVE